MADPREEVRLEAHRLGFDLVGFASAEPFPSDRLVLEERRARGLLSPFEEPDAAERCEPSQWLSGARTIIALGVSYAGAVRRGPADAVLRGLISMHARGEDYHRLMHRRAGALVTFLGKRFPGIHCRVFVDTGPPVERSVAARSGLGWFGKNSSLITSEFGSLVYLGEIVTDIAFTPDDPMRGTCGSCTRCLDACPTGALAEPYVVDSSRCVSQLTQIRGLVPRELRAAMADHLYGCDICQEVCPFNLRFTHDAPPSTEGRPRLEEVLRLGNLEFRQTIGATAAGWRGRTTIQRNAVIALGNSGDPQALPTLVAALGDPRWVIRAHAAWGLGSLGGEGEKRALMGRLEVEDDPRVREEIGAALGGVVV